MLLHTCNFRTEISQVLRLRREQKKLLNVWSTKSVPSGEVLDFLRRLQAAIPYTSAVHRLYEGKLQEASARAWYWTLCECKRLVHFNCLVPCALPCALCLVPVCLVSCAFLPCPLCYVHAQVQLDVTNSAL